MVVMTDSQANQSDALKDNWSSEAYSTSAAFVPKLAQTLVAYLDAKQTDRVLDIGCGDGKFTENFLPAVGYVLGIDASPSMIEAAQKDFGSPKCEFRVVDCRFLGAEKETIVNESWDKVISNAALHWVLRDKSTRMSTLQAIYDSLKPGGTFVFEMGGHGNVAEAVTALIYALVQHGVPIERARDVNPWFFPSERWMEKALKDVGFEVQKVESEYRPTRLTTAAQGGIAGWIRLMGANFLAVLPEEKREIAVQQICDVLETAITRGEDGSQWLGYVRLRGIAKKVPLD